MIENTLKSSFIARWIRKALPLFLLLSGFAFGQANYTPAELDTLVSTIALYPDPLLIHVLTASTFGDQIPAANAFAQSHKNEKGETLAKSIEDANLTYDPSVQLPLELQKRGTSRFGGSPSGLLESKLGYLFNILPLRVAIQCLFLALDGIFSVVSPALMRVLYRTVPFRSRRANVPPRVVWTSMWSPFTAKKFVGESLLKSSMRRSNGFS